jgi:hypothetical protein
MSACGWVKVEKRRHAGIGPEQIAASTQALLEEALNFVL